MYYKITYSNNGKEEIKYVNKLSAYAEVVALGLLNSHNNEGMVKVERRASEYYGNYSFCYEIKRGKVEDADEKKIQHTRTSKRKNYHIKELCQFKKTMLEEESDIVQELYFLCVAKRPILKNSPLLEIYNKRISDIVKACHKEGIPYKELEAYMHKYECDREFNSK